MVPPLAIISGAIKWWKGASASNFLVIIILILFTLLVAEIKSSNRNQSKETDVAWAQVAYIDRVSNAMVTSKATSERELANFEAFITTESRENDEGIYSLLVPEHIRDWLQDTK